MIESTGRFRTRDEAAGHLAAGEGKVVVSAPVKGTDATVVLRVDFAEAYDPEKHHVVSNASCTTNCVAPVAKVLHEAVDIRHGLLTTIHAYTSDQRLVDLPHKDLLPGRSRRFSPTRERRSVAAGGRRAPPAATPWPAQVKMIWPPAASS